MSIGVFSHEFSLPRRVLVEDGALAKLDGVLRELGCRRIALLTDEVVYGIVGRETEERLIEQDLEVHTLKVGPATRIEFERCREFVEEVKADAVVGLGGGRVIDAAKYASFYAGSKLVSAPTAISHDGVASPTVSLKGEDGKPISIYTHPPHAIIADTAVIARAPRRLLASGFADIIGKLTSVRDAVLAAKVKGVKVSPLALELASTAARIAIRYVEKIASLSPEGVKALALAAIASGMAMAVDRSSRPCSGSEHLFSHALDVVAPEKKSLHGEQVGVGTIMMAYLHGISWRKVRKLLSLVGAPVDARGLGVKEDQIVQALTLAARIRKRYTILGEEGLTEEAAKWLAEETHVI